MQLAGLEAGPRRARMSSFCTGGFDAGKQNRAIMQDKFQCPSMVAAQTTLRLESRVYLNLNGLSCSKVPNIINSLVGPELRRGSAMIARKEGSCHVCRRGS